MNIENIEDIYKLSPMQQGMLFHSLHAPNSGMYFEQLWCILHEDLNLMAFEQAWQQVVDQHPILRTAFYWEEYDEPLQVVYRDVKLPINIFSWQAYNPEEQEQKLHICLSDDCAQGFDLSKPPLLRLTFIKLSEETYQFIWSYHHILLDRWSLQTIFKDLFTCYTAYKSNQKARLEHPQPYRDYISWLQKQDPSQAELFWRTALRGFRATTSIGIGTQLNREQSVEEYDSVEMYLSAETGTELQAFTRRYHITISTLVQTIWALLLNRYSNEDDVVFGATVSGRSIDLAHVDSMVGLFINTLPVRIHIDPKNTVLALLRLQQEQHVEMRQYEYTPLVQIQGWSDVPRGQPLFESIFSYKPETMSRMLQNSDSALNIKHIQAMVRTNYPLAVSVEAVSPHSFLIRIDYHSSRFDTATMERMVRHYQMLLEAVVADPTRPVGELPLLTTAELNFMLKEWNATTLPYPQHLCLHQLFEIQAMERPNKVAIIFEEKQLTYRELNRLANQLAHRLCRLGVKPDMRVGLCLERSLDMVVGVLGILKAGGAYVPLDPRYPLERLAFMLEDAQIQVLLTQQHLLDRLPISSIQIVSLDNDWLSISQEQEDNPRVPVTSRNLAYSIYTSGSTGKPKSVLINHSGVLNNIVDLNRRFGVNHNDRLLALSSLSFDMCVYDIFGPLGAGGTIILASSWQVHDPACVLKLLTEYQVTLWNSAPALLQALVDHASEQPDSSLDTLRLALLGGDWVPVTLPERLKKLAHAVRVISMGGATELSIHSTIYEVEQRDPTWKSIPYGQPMTNQQCYVLDPLLRPTPIGVIGELYLGGVGLARGYLNRPEQTAERFIPHPFSDIPGDRLYKTGDLVRYGSDGNLELLGRIDYQIKIRGFRIELGEIESILRKHPFVREGVVASKEVAPNRKELVAYIVPNDKTALTLDELRRFLEQRLPIYMVPTAFILLEAIPLSPNGKIDRRALPIPNETESELDTPFVPPRTHVEASVAEVWIQVLGKDRVGVYDNFFVLGGHSLLATQIVSRLRNSFEVELPLQAIFEDPTVAGIAARIENLVQQKHVVLPPIEPIRERGGQFPLSFSQQRLWFIQQLLPGNPLYNMSSALHLSGVLHPATLEASLQELVRRHEILRTTFAYHASELVQSIASALHIPLPLLDLHQLPAADRDAELQRLIAHDAQSPFDLATGPLLRATLLRLAPREHVLLLTLHHIIADGWSIGILVNEVSALYRAFLAHQPSPLAPLPLQYADFAVWQRAWLQGQLRERQLAYWKAHLRNAPAALDLPTDRPRPPLQSYQGHSFAFTLDTTRSAQLKQLSQREGVTVLMTLLAAFQVLLARYTGQQDIVVGMPIAGRTHAELEGLIGCFINMLVMRTDLSGTPTFLDLLKRVREAALAAYAHQDLPFEQLVEALQPVRDPSRSPLFQVAFVPQPPAPATHNLAGLVVRTLTSSSGTVKFDLTLDVLESEQELHLVVSYNTDLFDAATIERMAGHYQRLLAGIVEDASQRIGVLPLLTAAERQLLLEQGTATATPFPHTQCVHQLFEARAAAQPDAVALIYEQQALTYGALNRRANQLGHALRRLGVGPDTLVALCVERSPELLIGILGILKAGAAYLPLDPTYPHERLAFMLQDAQVPVLLTQQRLIAQLPTLPIQIFSLDADWPSIIHEPSTNLSVPIHPEHAAYVIYTSGSTGSPKGVLVSHANVARLFTATQDWFHFDASDVWTLFHSTSFDFSVWEIWGALAYGGRLVIVPHWVTRTPEAFYELLYTQQVTVLNQTPSSFQQLIQVDGTPSLSLPLALRYIIFGGEALNPQNLQPWIERHGDKNPQFINMYGITETTVHVTYRPLTANDLNQRSVIGRAIPDLRVYVLDQNQQLLPTGIPGELYVGGPGVARGYLNRPELTAERFIPDPFSPEPGARLYRTGDRVCYLPTGDIVFLGRLDHQVKIRGFRIELEEIETVLRQHRAIEEAVVVARTDEPGESRLVAYVIPIGDSLPSIEGLRHFLLKHLPDYMVPSAFIFLEALPLTSNGKIDRQALPTPGPVRPELEAQYVAPENALQHTIATVWQAALRLDRVGIHDNFFDLGGHSLLVVEVVERLRQVLERDIAILDLFHYPTVDAFTTYLIGDRSVELGILESQDGQARAEQRAALMRRRGRQGRVTQHNDLEGEVA